MKLGKISGLDPMDKNTGQEILSELKRITTLLEEQNDIMLFDDDFDVRTTNSCCPGCDGTCGEDN